MKSRKKTCVQLCILWLALFVQPVSASPEIPVHAVILQYHHVSDETPAITSIQPEQFKAHLDYLRRYKFKVWSLDHIMAAISQHDLIPDRTVAITFDDAYLSVYTTARPLLRDLNWSYTVFVSSNLIESNPGLYMSWSQLKEIQAEGALIANHTMNHPHLLRRSAGETMQQWRLGVIREIQGARTKIEQETGVDSNLLAYPYGEYDDAIRAIAKDLGMFAFGQQSGPVAYDSDLQALPRFPLSGIYSDLTALKLKLATLPFPIRSALPNPVLSVNEDRPFLEVKLAPGNYLIKQLACYTSHQGRNKALDLLDSGFRTRSNLPLVIGRSRYNCTMPIKQMPGHQIPFNDDLEDDLNAPEERRYYWFSQPWIRLNPDGTWFPEE